MDRELKGVRPTVLLRLMGNWSPAECQLRLRHISTSTELTTPERQRIQSAVKGAGAPYRRPSVEQ